MYCLIDFCCICFHNKEHLQPLSDYDGDNITYFIKLTSCISEMRFNEINDQWLVCKKCCEIIDAVYKFRQRCLKNKSTITDYISQLHQASDISGITYVYLTDINKFGDVKRECQIENNTEKTEMFINVNEKADEVENLQINLITEINRENNPFNSKLKDSEHIHFENVIVGMKREDLFHEENVEERFANPLVNQDEIKIGFSQNMLTVSAIKKENENQNFTGHLHESFGNILKTFTNENDDMTAELGENNYYPLYSEKYSDNSLTNLVEINIEEFSTKDKDISLRDEEKTAKEANCSYKTLEDKQKNTSLSRNPKQPKKCDEYDQKVTIVKKHECLVCLKKFLHPSLLNRHMLTHTGAKPHQCEVCQKKFNQLSTLRTHRIIHTGEKQHKCDICLKTFFKLFTLKEHIKTHTGEKSYECSVCQQKFTQLTTLRRHSKTHNEEKAYKCEICMKRFVKSFTLEEHMRTHTGETPYECSVCQKKFSQISTLRMHKKTHTEKSHKCEICLKSFVKLFTLTEHMRIHTGETAYECSVCQKKFAQFGTLSKHNKSHTGVKPYKCDVCQKKFIQKCHLKEHMLIHTGEKSSAVTSP